MLMLFEPILRIQIAFVEVGMTVNEWMDFNPLISMLSLNQTFILATCLLVFIRETLQYCKLNHFNHEKLHNCSK